MRSLPLHREPSHDGTTFQIGAPTSALECRARGPNVGSASPLYPSPAEVLGRSSASVARPKNSGRRALTVAGASGDIGRFGFGPRVHQAIRA